MGLIWTVALLVLGYQIYKAFFAASAEDKKRRIQSLLGYAITGALCWAAFRSGSLWLVGVVVLLYLGVRGVPQVSRHYEARRQSSGRQAPRTRHAMSRAEALELFGLEEGASEQQIAQRYKELMRKLHPDHGGSNELARRVNQAKRVLEETR